MAGLCAPLSTLRQYPHGYLRMTRGRCGSLLLHRDGLAPSTPCRSPGALRSTPINRHRYRASACLKRATYRHRRWVYRIIVHPGEQQVARIETFVWIVTTFIIIMAATPPRALAIPEASACGYLAGLIDKAPP